MTLEEVLRMPLCEILARLDRAEQAEAAFVQPGDRNLTADEAAEQLGVKKAWLYRHSNLPFVRHLSDRTVRYSEAGLKKWNANRKGK